MTLVIEGVTASTCLGCTKGMRMCRRPCWPTPEDAEKIIKKGHAAKLMLDWFWGPRGNWIRAIRVLAPANPGQEGRDASVPYIGSVPLWNDYGTLLNGCVFQGRDGLCQLHAERVKPSGGKLVCCKDDQKTVDLVGNTIGRTWATKEAKALVEQWKKMVNYKP